jgi:hypothetical protein
VKTVGAWSSRAVLALLLGGCSLAALDGYSDGAPNTPDGGESQADAMASSDAPTDSATSVDGGGEAATPFCASRSPQPALCLDFDSDPAFGTWVLGSDKGGKVEPSSAAFVSPPRSAFLSRATGLASAARMGLRYTLAGSRPDEIVLATDVRIDQIDTNQEMDFFSVVFPSVVGGEAAELQLSVADGAFQFEAWSYPPDGGDTHNFSSFERAVPTAKWIHLELNLRLTAPGNATLTVDGVAAPQIPITLPSGLGAPTIGLGDDYLLGGPYALYMDNFTATVK